MTSKWQFPARFPLHFYTRDKSEIILTQFRMYDVDENGMIDLNEMTKLVRSIFKVSNQSQVTLEKKNSDKMLFPKEDERVS